jgi:hypothetical protein
MGNKMTLVGVLGEELGVPQTPIQVPSLALLQRWRLSNEEMNQGAFGEFSFEMEWPTRARNRFPHAQTLPPARGLNVTTLSFVFKFINLVLPAKGEYRFRTYLNDKEASVYKFYVALQSELATLQAQQQQLRAGIGFHSK